MADTLNNLDVAPIERLAHGFRRTLFGFSPSFRRDSSQDKYGYLFKTKSSGSRSTFSPANRQLMDELGRTMIESSFQNDAPGFSTIDAGYTYFGQFVDHDLTLDVDSSTKVDRDATTLINYRTPNLDLDSVYGNGPAIDSYMYDADGLRFITGNNNSFDLPRTVAGTAIIGDPRNDENLIVAQFHGSMLRFHNAVIDQLRRQTPAMPNDELFKNAQEEVRRHYQWVVLHDYLQVIVGSELIEDLLTNGLKLLTPRWSRKFVMPVEFSVAAYRFGHSMIRDRYRFNSVFDNHEFFNAFTFTKSPVPSVWNIHWPSFFGTGNQPASNKARRIDTRVAFSMGNLPSALGAPPESLFTVLSSRNLVRSLALRVPTGQYMAKRMKETPLTTEQLLSDPNKNPSADQRTQHESTTQLLQSNGGMLLRQTPLWYYILKEAEVLNDGNQLGPVGGHIVAEVFMRLLIDDKASILNNPEWKPRFGVQGNSSTYKITDLLRFAGTYPTPGVS